MNLNICVIVDYVFLFPRIGIIFRNWSYYLLPDKQGQNAQRSRVSMIGLKCLNQLKNYKLFNAFFFVVSLFTISILPTYLAQLTLEVEVMIWFQFVQSFNFLLFPKTPIYLLVFTNKDTHFPQSANRSDVFRSMCVYRSILFTHIIFVLQLNFAFFTTVDAKTRVCLTNSNSVHIKLGKPWLGRSVFCDIAKNMSDLNLRAHYHQASTSLVTTIVSTLQQFY